ncbi:hypothetical protein ACFL6O_05165 [candidate division KSB1 bacterium]
MLDKIENILSVQPHVPNHHFGRPFLTPYQIAIRFEDKYQKVFQKIGKPVGGKNTGQKDSLAQYIALELSRRIKSKEIDSIEGAFLYRDKQLELIYKDDDVEATSGQYNDLSMYRYCKKD